MSEAEQIHFRRLLRSRADRLVALIDLNAPLQVIANEVGLVDRAAWGYCPTEMGASLAVFGRRDARKRAHLCIECGAALSIEDAEFCASCAKIIEDDDPEACPGCGAMPGDGLTTGCDDMGGCGHYRKEMEG